MAMIDAMTTAQLQTVKSLLAGFAKANIDLAAAADMVGAELKKRMAGINVSTTEAVEAKLQECPACNRGYLTIKAIREDVEYGSAVLIVGRCDCGYSTVLGEN